MLPKKMVGYKMHKKYMLSVNSAFIGFLKHHKMMKQKTYGNSQTSKMLDLTTSSSLLELLKSTIFKNFFKPKFEWHGFFKLK